MLLLRPAPSGVKCARKCCLQTSRFTFADRGLPNAELLLLLNKCVSAATSFVCLCCTHIPTQCYHLYIQCVVALLRAWSHSFEPDETITEINVEGLRAFRVVALASHSCFLRLRTLGNALGNEGVDAVVVAINGSRNLRTLNLSSARVRSAGLVKLADVLQTHSTLEVLTLESECALARAEIKQVACFADRNHTATAQATSLTSTAREPLRPC